MRASPLGAAVVLALSVGACGGTAPAADARSPGGAVAAATDDLVSIAERFAAMDPVGRDAAVAAMSTAAGAASLRATAEPTFRVIDVGRAQHGFGPLVGKAVPVAYHVDAFGPDRANVQVWMCTVMTIDGALDPTTQWTTSHLRMRWTAGGWRLDGADFAIGPTPAPDPLHPTSPPADALATLLPFASYRYAAS